MGALKSTNHVLSKSGCRTGSSRRSLLERYSDKTHLKAEDIFSGLSNHFKRLIYLKCQNLSIILLADAIQDWSSFIEKHQLIEYMEINALKEAEK